MADTVTVACKLPSGVMLSLPGHQPVRVHGFSTAVGTVPEHQIAGGFALTHGVPRDFWEEWVKRVGKDFDAHQRGLIFALPQPQKAADAAKERKDERSGLEPIDPGKPGRGLEPVSVTPSSGGPSQPAPDTRNE